MIRRFLASHPGRSSYGLPTVVARSARIGLLAAVLAAAAQVVGCASATAPAHDCNPPGVGAGSGC
jgi:hypothetical protein